MDEQTITFHKVETTGEHTHRGVHSTRAGIAKEVRGEKKSKVGKLEKACSTYGQKTDWIARVECEWV